MRELVEHMLGITGKDEARVRDLLLRGTLVSGATRFRWTGMETDPASVRALLGTFPDPEPARPFAAGRCVRVVLRTPRHPIGIPREIGESQGILRRLLRRPSFWNLLMDVAAGGEPRYSEYSYRDRADIYQLALDGPQAQRVREGAHLVRYTALETQIRNAPIESAEFCVVRAD
jgi:hypothetical protein